MKQLMVEELTTEKANDLIEIISKIIFTSDLGYDDSILDLIKEINTY